VTPRPGGPETGPGGLGSAVVIGTGLIGTSIALALCEQGVTVWLTDHDPAAARLAAELGAGKILPEPLGAVERGEGAPEAAAPGQRPQAQEGPWADLAVLAVPPAAVASSLAAAQARRSRCGKPASWVATWPASCPATRCPGGSAQARPPRGPICSSAARG
jgi:threonine dehydrogenase-like Zn-dependent dehydrogenase